MTNRRGSTLSKHSVTVVEVLSVSLAMALMAFVAVSLNSHRRASPGQTESTTPFNVPPPSLTVSLARYTPIAARQLFPYSVVPGGVESPRELMKAIGNDSAVGATLRRFQRGGRTRRLAAQRR